MILSCSLSEDAYQLYRCIHDTIQKRNTEQYSESEGDSDSEDDCPEEVSLGEMSVPECAEARWHRRYLQQLGRIAVCLHLLEETLPSALKGQDITSIPNVISRDTVEKARFLLDHVTLQKDTLLKVSHKNITTCTLQATLVLAAGLCAILVFNHKCISLTVADIWQF